VTLAPSMALVIGFATTTAPRSVEHVQPRALPTAHGPACGTEAWTALSPVEWGGAEVWFASIADYKGREYVVGDSVLVPANGHTPIRPLVALDVGGRRPLTAPDRGMAFAYPLATAGKDGLEMVWGEGPAIDPRRPGVWPPAITELWRAVYTPNIGWSPAQQIFRAPNINWTKWGIDRLPAAAGRPAFFAAPISDPSAGGILLVRAASRDSVSTSVIHRPRGGGGVAYTAIARNSVGDLLMGFIAADVTTVGHDENSVFVTRSTDGGITWTSQALVSRSGTHQASQVRAVTDGPTFHLVWLQALSGEQAPEVIRHISSTDGGETWSKPDDVPLPKGVELLRVAADRCGVHAVVESYGNYTGLGASLFYAHASRDSLWSPMSEPFPGQLISGPDLVTGNDGIVRLTAIRWSKPDSGTNWARTVLSELRNRP
jgi:hypothetical protein